MHKAVRLLRASELGPAYQTAWEEWDGSEEATLWDQATGDGLGV